MKHPLQDWLRENKDLKKLTEEFGINVTENPTLPLIICKYSQIDSPKSHPVVRYSRGTVLEKETYDLISQSMVRFYNWTEGPPEDIEKFNWGNFTCLSKEDGSIINLSRYTNPNIVPLGEWISTTSGSFGIGEIVQGTGITWRSLFTHTIKWDENKIYEKLNQYYTYIFEMCSLYNKVVRTYEKPQLFLLGVYNIKNDPYELSEQEVDEIALTLGVPRPTRYSFTSLKEIEVFLEKQEKDDPTFEGVVIRDNQNIRFKIKSKTYLTLHRIKDNGAIVSPKNIIPWVLKGETDELLIYFSELKTRVLEIKDAVEKEWDNLRQVHRESLFIASQKDFALFIKPRTKFTSILFEMRKNPLSDRTEDSLKKVWLSSEELINKILFKG